MRELLKTLPFSILEKKSENLVQTLHKLLRSNDISSKNLNLIGGYAPMKSEVDWVSLTSLFQVDLAFPGTDSEGVMHFYQCRVDQLVETNDFGVTLRVPPAKAPCVLPNIFLIPGLAFSKEGLRLGRGKGYYDRYLSQRECIKIGLCFDEQMIEQVPADPHDVKMDYVVSEHGVYAGGRELAF
jgi:5-formyltetrahydrofolate cyclo-ligase